MHKYRYKASPQGIIGYQTAVRRVAASLLNRFITVITLAWAWSIITNEVFEVFELDPRRGVLYNFLTSVDDG